MASARSAHLGDGILVARDHELVAVNLGRDPPGRVAAPVKRNAFGDFPYVVPLDDRVAVLSYSAQPRGRRVDILDAATGRLEHAFVVPGNLDFAVGHGDELSMATSALELPPLTPLPSRDALLAYVDHLPALSVSDGRGSWTEQPLLDCSRLFRPARLPGPGLAAVTRFRFDDGLRADAIGLVGAVDPNDVFVEDGAVRAWLMEGVWRSALAAFVPGEDGIRYDGTQLRPSSRGGNRRPRLRALRPHVAPARRSAVLQQSVARRRSVGPEAPGLVNNLGRSEFVHSPSSSAHGLHFLVGDGSLVTLDPSANPPRRTVRPLPARAGSMQVVGDLAFVAVFQDSGYQGAVLEVDLGSPRRAPVSSTPHQDGLLLMPGYFDSTTTALDETGRYLVTPWTGYSDDLGKARVFDGFVVHDAETMEVLALLDHGRGVSGARRRSSWATR